MSQYKYSFGKHLSIQLSEKIPNPREGSMSLTEKTDHYLERKSTNKNIMRYYKGTFFLRRKLSLLDCYCFVE